MRFLSTLLLIFLNASFTFAHLGGITGTVRNDATGQPLPGVTVHLTGLGRATVTNELGQYRFVNLPPAPYRVELSFVGYQTQTIVVEVKDDEVTTVQTRLTTASIALNEVTVSALKAHDQQLISSLDIRLRPITNSQEILRLVPGLFIGQHAGGGKAEQLFLRGFDLDHGTDIRLTVDDMPVNMVSHAHGQGYADLHFVIPELVEGVDFAKGPYRTDKGNFTTAGWANFRTRTALDRSFAKLEVGQYNTIRAVTGLNLLGANGIFSKNKNDVARTGGQSAYVASEYSFSDSYFDTPQHFKRVNVLGKYHGHLSPGTQLTLTASTFWSKWNHSGQIPDRAVADGLIGFFGAIDPTEGGETSRTNLNAQLVTVTPRGHTLRSQLFYSNYNFELYSNFTFFLRDSINGDQIRQRERRNLFGYNGSYAIQSQVGRSQWTTTFGAQYRQDLTGAGATPTELSYTRNRTETLERVQYGTINELNAALYADEVVQLSNRFTLNAGLRYDFFRSRYTDLRQSPATVRSTTQGVLSPKLNLYFTANPRLQVYLNTGRGFHSNDTRVVVAQNGPLRRTGEVLPPAYGSDLGVIVKPFPKLLINAAAWYLWLAQEFVYVGDEGVVEPSGRSRRMGIDVSARYQLTRHLYADLDLNTARPRAIGAEAGQAYLPLAPVFTSVGGLSLQNAGPWSGSLRYRYIADRPANEDNSIVAKGYFVNDLLVNYSRRKYMLSLSVQNLFDTRWKETQFATESRLQGEAAPVEEIHFTPGTPFFARLSCTFFW